MELRHLRYFVAVAEELHFRRAAERLHISQPPLSQQIRQLEQEVGVTLLERDRRSVSLTAAGEAFLPEARAVLDGVERAVERARRVARGEVGRLSVAFVGSAMYGAVPDILRDFRERHPEVELELRELSSGMQVEALRGGRVDAGFLRPPVADEDLASEPVSREPIVAALPAGHALADGGGPLRLEQLRGESFVLLDRREAPGLHNALVRAMSQVGGPPAVAQEVVEMQTVVALVAAGLGVSLVPATVSALDRDDVVYRPVEGIGEVELDLAWRRDDRSPVLAAFRRLVGERRGEPER